MRQVEKSNSKKWIWEYKRRRKILRDNIDRIDHKIWVWQKAVEKIEGTEDFLKGLVNEVNEYFSVDITSRVSKQNVIVARSVYYKIAIESGIYGTVASKHIKRTKSYGCKDRMNFTRTLKKNKSNREAFHNFKQYFENK